MAHDELIARTEAADRVLGIRNSHRVLETEVVGIDVIDGRELATDIVADADQPAHSHATMDGFAFDATDSYPFEVIDEVYPEDEPPAIEPGEAVRIATGAPLPQRANAVLKREESDVSNDQLTGSVIEPGTYVYERASNVAAGETLFNAGERLAARDAILLRDLGYEEVEVGTRPTVGILATGTEIHEGRSRDLDSPMLAGMVRRWGGEPSITGTVPDDFERVRDRIAELAAEYDVVVTTGGTSVGRKDYVVRALAELGEVDFHGVRIRPGKPIAVATLSDAVAFAIPGKPVGAHTIATAVMRPFFTGTTSLSAMEARFERHVAIPRSGFEYWIPVTLDADAGTIRAMPFGHQDSALAVYEDTFNPSVLSSSTRATRADGVVITETGLEAGETVDVHPWSSFQ